MVGALGYATNLHNSATTMQLCSPRLLGPKGFSLACSRLAARRFYDTVESVFFSGKGSETADHLTVAQDDLLSDKYIIDSESLAHL